MEGDPMAVALALPDDALADILRRLPPRNLAASRCVCKAWRAAVDGRRLLRADLLPQSHSVQGIFLMFNDLLYPVFLSRPSSAGPDFFANIDHDIHRHADSYQWCNFASVLDHCNGLLLYNDPRGLHVSNPATQRWTRLPPPPRFRERSLESIAYLLFDPAESPHYEVLIVPDHPTVEEWDEEEMDEERRQQQQAMLLLHTEEEINEQARPQVRRDREWPASTWVLCVFSSCTGQWKERAFVREGEAAGMASDEALRLGSLWEGYGVYWRGAFFVQCTAGSTVMRISLANDKYQVIKMPTEIRLMEYHHEVYLGRLNNGVCLSSFDDRWGCKFRVWILDESCGKIEWVLKHHVEISHSVSRVMIHREEIERPWILQYGNFNELHGINTDEDDIKTPLAKSCFEWDSDNDNIFSNEYEAQEGFQSHITFLGFHPYKDVVFLDLDMRRAVAYHLNTSIIQDLGNLCPRHYCGHAAMRILSFVYTPCFMTEFPGNELEAQVEG